MANYTKEEYDEFLRDTLITAVEGGIGYWSKTLEYHPDQTIAVIQELNEDGSMGEKHTINAALIEKSLNKIVNRETREKMDSEFIEAVLYAKTYADAGEFDAEMADVIIQIGLFEEVVYG